MFRKYQEILLIALLSALLTALLVFFLKQSHLPDGEKSQFQISVENSSNRWNDLFYKSHNQRLPADNVVVVAIDEPSLIEIGRWPWSRNIINEISKQLLSYNVKTISYDIFFSEKENEKSDNAFVETVKKNADKMIFGTYSQTKSKASVKAYQDYCITQAFLYTGGDSLVKVNPFFAVLDDTNKYEEVEFNKLFIPIFRLIEQRAEQGFLVANELKNVSSLSQYQLNTLSYYKKQSVYDYCADWLTDQDEFDYKFNSRLKELYFKLFKASNDNELTQALKDFKKENRFIPIPQYVMWLQNIDSLQSAATYTASLVSHPDYDGVVRGYPLVLRTGNQLGTSYIPSLALQAYLAATGYQAQFRIELKDGKKQVTSAEIHDVSGDSDSIVGNVPVNEEAKLVINYYGKKNAITYVSAKELLNGSDKIEYFVREDFSKDQISIPTKTADKKLFLAGKNVIIGATAIGIYDIRTTPNDINYPGPEIHATVLSNLFHKDFLSYPPNEKAIAPFIFFIFLFYNLVVLIKTGARFGVFYFAFTFLGILVYQYNKFENGTVYASSMLFATLYTAAYFLTFIYKYFFQSRRSNAIKRAFSKYVSKDVVEEILKNENAIELRGQKLHMSVLFSDIRGFTSFSENMDPVEVSELLNLYFTPMSAIITAHQGTIDKYIGDAIMAMFGAPINYKEHASLACSAALGCVEQLKKVNEEFAKRNWPLIRAGIGINSGYMNAGNIGSETIQNYTVIGDSVNLASRVQALNKEYNTQILITEFTYELVKDQFNCREIDRVVLRGRHEPIRIYELIGSK